MSDLSELDHEIVPLRMIGEAANGAIMSGGTLQQVRSSYATAVACQIPREIDRVRRRIEDEGRLAGEEFYYGWGAGKDRIEGPSIKLANALARCWGNCAIELLPIQETPDAWIFTAVFVDLETGFTLPRQFRQAKQWVVHGKFDAARKDDIRFQIGQSKAIRNVILNALPASLVERAMTAAKSGVREKLQAYIQKNSIAAAQDLLIGELAKLGVKEEAILRRCGVAARKAISVEQLVVLRGDISAIGEGQERAEDLFPVEAWPQTVKELAGALGVGNGSGNGKLPTPPPAPVREPEPLAPSAAPKLAEPPVTPTPVAEIPTLPGPPPAPKKVNPAQAVRVLRKFIQDHELNNHQIAAAMVKAGLRGEEETNPVDFAIAGLDAESANRLIDVLSEPGE